MPKQPLAPLDEEDARRVLLARAMETADGGRLLPEDERQRIDRAAREQVLQDAGERDADPGRLLRLRADRVIAAVGVREPGLVALLEPSPWPGRIAWALPVAAALLGAGSDWVGEPHRVNLLSIPLLGLLAWNLAVYALLLAGLLRRGGERRSWLAGLGGWSDGARALRRGGPARVQARILFQRDWLQATRGAELARWTRVLHLSAAAWALGWLASLVVRGLVVEYRVGWESTFLGPAQVHALLAAMRAPASWMLALPPLSLDEVAALHFSAGGGGTAAGGRGWVAMVGVLLAAVVVLPRVVLAAVAGWQGWRARRRPQLALDDPYFGRLFSLLDTGRVLLALVATAPADAQWLRRRVAMQPAAWPVVARSGQGDELRLQDDAEQAPAVAGTDRADAAAVVVRAGWWPWRGRGRGEASALRPAAALAVLPAGAALDEARARAQALQLPLLAIRRAPAPAATVDAARAAAAAGLAGVQATDDPPDARGVRGGAGEGGDTGRVVAVLDGQALAAGWGQPSPLYAALAGLLPGVQAQALQRIAADHAAQDAARLRQALQAAALHLLHAARQQEELHGLAGGWLPGARREAAQAQEQAMDAIMGRVREDGARYLDRLRELHGLDPGELALAEAQLEARFEVAGPVHAPQAGMAGAATGAALGAGVDLATGGLTLGAAAALGALLGGGAAYVGALWKNRSTPAGGTLVQLSEPMLQALAEASLLQYLAVLHAPQPPAPAWPGRVAQALAARAPQLAPFWTQARTQPDAHRLALPLGHVLEAAARELLAGPAG